MKLFRPFAALPLLITAPFVLTSAGCAQNNAAPVANLAQAPAEAPMQIPIADEAAFFDALDLDLPALKDVKTAVLAKNWDAAKVAWARHLETRTNVKWLWSHRDKAKIQALLAQKGDDLSGKIAPADLVLARTFNPQGKVRQLDKDINWIIAGEETHVLSRFAYFSDLGLASWKTGDAKYATDFVAIFRDWLTDNPVPTDLSRVTKPNTTWRTLETGIRVTQWFNDMELFMDAPQFDAQAKYEMSKSLMEHARYLYEWTPKFRGGNWQVIEATGLATAGIMLPEVKQSKAWRERGLLRLTEHMEQDILPDGGHSELTPSYHQWVMQQYANTAQLAKINGIDAAGLTARHEKMYEWFQKLSQPDGIVPPIADTHDPLDIRDDMATGALMYDRPDFKFLGAKSGPASWVWLFGADAFEQYAKMPSKEPNYTSVLLADSKYATMRSGWNPGDNYFLFDAAPGSIGHSHADKLQILAYAGRPLLIDPGIYSYGEPLSTKYFRNPEAHNVVLIDGKGSPREKGTDARLDAWQSGSEADFASGTTDFGGFRVQRSVVFVKPGYSVVVDHITSAANDATEHEIKRLFHFPIGEAKSDANIAQTAFKDGKNLQIQVADGGKLAMEKGWFPTEPAKAVEAPVAVFAAKGKLPMTLVTVLTPFAAPNQLPKVENMTGNAQIAHVRLSFPGGQRDEIMVAAQTSALKIGAQQKTGRVLVVRSGPQSQVSTVLDGSMNEKVAAVAPAKIAVAPDKTNAGTGISAMATITASSSQPDYGPSNATDKNATTFWVSKGTKPGEGPSSKNSQWVQLSYETAQNASALKIAGRAGYSPKTGEIQASNDGKTFRVVKPFALQDGEETVVSFAPTTAKFFRVSVSSAYDKANPEQPRNVQINELTLMTPVVKP